MTFRTTAVWCFATVTITLAEASFAQKPPYDVFPPAEPPYYRVRYEAFGPAGRTELRGQLHDLDPAGREDAARRHRAPARLRRGVVQVGADGRLRPALAGPGEEARLRAARSGLRAAGEGRLPDVVRPAERLRRGVPEVPRRSRREVGPPRAGQGAVGAVGTQRRRPLGRRHGAAASGPRRRRVAALGRAAAEAGPGAPDDQGAHPARRRAEGAGDVQPGHEGRRDGERRSLRRRLAGQRSLLQRGARQGRAHRRGRRSADQPRVRQPALPRHPLARCLPDRPPAEGPWRAAPAHADGAARGSPRSRTEKRSRLPSSPAIR